MFSSWDGLIFKFNNIYIFYEQFPEFTHTENKAFFVDSYILNKLLICKKIIQHTITHIDKKLNLIMGVSIRT